MFIGLPTFLVFFVTAVVIVLLIMTASQHRRHSSATDPRTCRGCGASHPPFAEYCRRCGKKL